MYRKGRFYFEGIFFIYTFIFDLSIVRHLRLCIYCLEDSEFSKNVVAKVRGNIIYTFEYGGNFIKGKVHSLLIH